MKTIDKILIILCLFLCLFCAAVFYVFVKTGGQEPVVLVGGVVGAIVSELIILFRIKAGKKRQEYADKNENNVKEIEL